MKRALLILPVLIETAFGLLYMTSLLLLPAVFSGYFPFMLIVPGLGMPRRYGGPAISSPEVQHFNHVMMFAGLLIVTFLVLNGLLWFKDVSAIIRKLRAKQYTPHSFK